MRWWQILCLKRAGMWPCRPSDTFVNDHDNELVCEEHQDDGCGRAIPSPAGLEAEEESKSE